MERDTQYNVDGQSIHVGGIVNTGGMHSQYTGEGQTLHGGWTVNTQGMDIQYREDSQSEGRGGQSIQGGQKVMTGVPQILRKGAPF